MLTAQNEAGDKTCVDLRLPWGRQLPCWSLEPSCGRPTPRHGNREPSISPASPRIIPRLNRWAALATGDARPDTNGNAKTAGAGASPASLSNIKRALQVSGACVRYL